MRVGGTALVVALAGVILPFVMGWGIATLWGEPRLESIFIGAAMVATSVGITAQVLAARGLLDYPRRPHHSRRGGRRRCARPDRSGAGQRHGAGLGTLPRRRDHRRCSPWASPSSWPNSEPARCARVMPRVQAGLSLAEGEFALAMTLLFALRLLAVYAGVAAIVGRVSRRHGALRNGRPRGSKISPMASPNCSFPFFLAGIGLHFDMSAFGTASTLGTRRMHLARGRRFEISRLRSRRSPHGPQRRPAVGVGMIPRGEVGMVVAQIGLRMGVMAERSTASSCFMSVATTLIAPPLLKLAFRGERPSAGRKNCSRLG